MATLYVVATPIGNLRDMTFRAVDVLKAASLICCEDTRETRKLLTAYGISRPVVSVRAANEESGAGLVLQRLEAGEDVAYVSDAGTPGLSDPGTLLASLVRRAGHPVLPIPGPSALAALVSAAGVPAKPLLFEGFLSVKSGKRRRRLEELTQRGETFVVYESPHRLLKLLGELRDVAPRREIVVGRELTKRFEEIVAGPAADLLTLFEQRGTVKGECTVLVSPSEMG